MKRPLGSVLAPLTVLAAVLLGPGPAAADPVSELRPIGLRVFDDDGDGWHAANDFRMAWDRPPIAELFPVTAADHRVRDQAGVVVVPAVRHPGNVNRIEHLRVPPQPGVYIVDVWLEGPAGQAGPKASTTLRFDDARPANVRPLVPAGWISAGTRLRIEHPAGPQPISGIRGYAISVDRSGDSTPCATPGWCRPAETDLAGGIDDDSFLYGALPEGTSVVRAVAVSGSGMSSAATQSATVHVDASRPEVVLSGATAGWANGPVQVRVEAADALSGMAAGGPDGPFTAIAVDGEVPRVERGAVARATVTGNGAHDVAFYARDAVGNSREGAPSRALVRIDEEPPQVAFTRAQDPADPERIEAAVADRLSGPDPARGSIALRPRGSRQLWEPLPTEVRPGRLVARWDSDASAAGTYEFRATAFDLAGNAGSGERRGDGARMVLSNPLKARTAIAAGFGGRRLVWPRCTRREGQRRCRREAIDAFELRPQTRAVPYGHGIAFAGQLTSAAGSRLGGLPIEIVESFAAGAGSLQRTTTARTAADGSFLTRLAPGPSRRVEVVFAGTRTLSRAHGESVRLEVLAGVRMRASSGLVRVGGAPVIFSGSVGDLGAPTPSGGRPVELQFRLPGREWSEFRTVQTDAHGRFRYPYAFSDDDSRGVRFQFRAYAPAAEDWPYEPAFSRPVFVTGR